MFRLAVIALLLFAGCQSQSNKDLEQKLQISEVRRKALVDALESSYKVQQSMEQELKNVQRTR